jgi:hypothetical protein
MIVANSSADGSKTEVSTSANTASNSNNNDNNTDNNTGNSVAALYNQINFGNNKISFEAFSSAYKGYTNLKKAGKLSEGKDIITVADFSLASNQNRLWVIDLAKKTVLFNTYVAHGSGSGNAYATAFSNNDQSHQSSLGFYVTGSTYCGKHGCSLRIAGMDQGFNDKAEARSVVMHSAAYVSASRAKTGSIGRSWGCPAVSPELAQPIINTIKDGTCLFIYAPQQKYLQSSQWLNA